MREIFERLTQKNGHTNPFSLKMKTPTMWEINFIQVPPEDLREEVLSEAAEAEEEGSPGETSEPKSNKENRPKFGPIPDLDSDDILFQS